MHIHFMFHYTLYVKALKICTELKFKVSLGFHGFHNITFCCFNFMSL